MDNVNLNIAQYMMLTAPGTQLWGTQNMSCGRERVQTDRKAALPAKKKERKHKAASRRRNRR